MRRKATTIEVFRVVVLCVFASWIGVHGAMPIVGRLGGVSVFCICGV